jgi:PPK2 family polyphosphate:nucleotide phosphotransferase
VGGLAMKKKQSSLKSSAQSITKSGKDFYEICSDEPLSLRRIPVKSKTTHHSDKQYQDIMEHNHAQIGEFQTRLYAEHSRAVLIVLQGMDTSGKDGTIKHVMSGVNPQGCQVVSFKTPTSTDLDHDFLWRVNCALPIRGHIGIFNRSYYEEVLITHIHTNLIDDEMLPAGTKHGAKFWKHRYQDIVNHENYLHRQGYEIIKFFIHISKDEQKKRLLHRFEDKNKHWKISQSDVRERKFWREYQTAYEECIGHTASKSCPWYIVPGDDKKEAQLTISKILVHRLQALDLDYPKLTSDQEQKLDELKAELLKS